jgi:hypothetical protein
MEILRLSPGRVVFKKNFNFMFLKHSALSNDLHGWEALQILVSKANTAQITTELLVTMAEVKIFTFIFVVWGACFLCHRTSKILCQSAVKVVTSRIVGLGTLQDRQMPLKVRSVSAKIVRQWRDFS